MKKFLNYLDKYLRKYIGMEKEEIVPEGIKKNGNKLLLINTEAHKRHVHTQDLGSFLTEHITKLNDPTKEKLGISFGKALANNLVISFEKTTIKKKKTHA